MLSRTMHFVIDEIVVFGEVLASVGRCWGIFWSKMWTSWAPFYHMRP